MKRQIGSVKERPKGSGKWQIKWYSLAENCYHTKTVSAKNETEARKMLGKAIAEYEDEYSRRLTQQQKRDSATVAEILHKYLEDHSATRLRRTTYQNYEAIIRNHLIPKLGHIKASELTARAIGELYNWALKYGRTDGKGGLSAQSVRHIHRVFHKAFVVAARRGWVEVNPVTYADAPTPDRVEMHVLNADQLVELLELVNGTKYELPIVIGAFTGMRRGEILGLKWDCVDLDNNTITVIRSLEEVKGGLFLGDTKTGSSRRTIPISSTLVSALQRQMTEQDRLKEELGELYYDQGFVCAEEDGSPIRPKKLSTAFRAIVDNTGLPRVRFHDLSRHTPASIMLGLGEHAKIVQEHLGHANYGITMDTYSHVSTRMSRDAIERYDKSIQEAATKRRIQRKESISESESINTSKEEK